MPKLLAAVLIILLLVWLAGANPAENFSAETSSEPATIPPPSFTGHFRMDSPLPGDIDFGEKIGGFPLWTSADLAEKNHKMLPAPVAPPPDKIPQKKQQTYPPGFLAEIAAAWSEEENIPTPRLTSVDEQALAAMPTAGRTEAPTLPSLTGNRNKVGPERADNRCGPRFGGAVCGPGRCCNQRGFCGFSAANCMPGQNIGFNGIGF